MCWTVFLFSWLVVLGFNSTLTAKVISWQSVTHMCFLAFSHQYLHHFSFQTHRLLFSHAFAEVRGENTPERKVASTGDRTHNHQVMNPTRSPLSHPGGTFSYLDWCHGVMIYLNQAIISPFVFDSDCDSNCIPSSRSRDYIVVIHKKGDKE